MTKELQELTPAELGKLFPIIIKPWNPSWAHWFQQERKKILDKFGKDQVVGIHHIGSTAILNIQSKPCVDILLQVPEDCKKETIIQNFKDLYYEFIPKPENPPPHMMFAKGYTKTGFKGQTAHIHVRFPGQQDEIVFRDYLNSNPGTARAYESLKIKLAGQFPNDREAYTEAKTDFVQQVLKLAK